MLVSLLLVFLAVFPVAALAGPGDLLVTPTRLVFESRTRSAEVGLVNTGTERASYRITLVNRRMTKLGEFEPVTEDTKDPSERFADHMIRYYPKRIELEPGESQTVRLQLRKPALLKEGEYRSHLQFKAIPRHLGRGPVNEPGKLSVRLTPIYGMSIPVIVRHGKTEAALDIPHLRLVRLSSGEPGIQLLLQREGNQSVYGDLKTVLTTKDGEQHTLHSYKGIAVYYPNQQREIRLPWSPPSDLELEGAVLKAMFTDRSDSSHVLAEKSVPLR